MVTIRNDIESNGNVNRSPDSVASGTGVVDGSKNVNHLVNGSRRSTMGDIRPKSLNRKCVGFLALVVCVGVCFGVGMLFLYGHLVDRLNESASNGAMLHDKNGNPVMTLTITTSTSSTPTSTSIAPTTTDSQTSVNVSAISTVEPFAKPLGESEDDENKEVLDIDSSAGKDEKSGQSSTEALITSTRPTIEERKDNGAKQRSNICKEKGSGSQFSGSGSDTDDDSSGEEDCDDE